MPQANTSFRLRGSFPLSICMIRQRPFFFSQPGLEWMSIFCPTLAGPAKVPRSSPPVNICLADFGITFDNRISTFLVLDPQQSSLLKRTTFSMDVIFCTPKFMASQGAGSGLVWHRSFVAEPSVILSMHLSALKATLDKKDALGINFGAVPQGSRQIKKRIFYGQADRKG